MKIIVNRNIIKYILYVILLICFTKVATAQIAIVVSKENPVNDISLSELKQIYLGTRTIFSDGKNIVLVEYLDLKEKFYDILLGWSLIKYKKHWMKLIFSGESSSAPKEFKSANKLKDFIIANEGAIAFIALVDVDDNMKVLTIDRKKTGSRDYPFK